MGIFGKKNEVAAILAEHGRWVARLRDDVKVMGQRLHSLERRVSAVEYNLAELAKDYGGLDIALSKLESGNHRARGCRR